jgi:UDP-glucose 4-epimerase
MKVLVTGADGFIGRYLTEMLGDQDIGCCAANHYDIDVTHPNGFRPFDGIDFDAVIHLAAKLMINGHTPEEYFEANTLGTLNVLEFCRRNKIPKLIYAMTHSDTNLIGQGKIYPYGSQMYGTTSWEHNAIPFIQSKVAAADMVEAYNRMKVVKGYILRLANIRGYGSSDTKYNSPFHQFINKARNGEPIEVWGDPPTTARDFIYIKDVCDAFIKAVETEDAPVGYYNIGSGKPLTILDEIKAICRVFCHIDNPSKIIMRPDISEVRTKGSNFDIEKSIKYLNWVPKYNYDAALVDFKREAGWID